MANIVCYLLILQWLHTSLHAATISQSNEQPTCYATEAEPHLKFATKTSYFFSDHDEEAEPIKLPGCKPRSFWLFSRHGARNPSGQQMKDMKERGPEIQSSILANHQEGKGKLCADDLKGIEGWSFDLNESEGKFLVPSGQDELREIGERWRKRLPTLLQGSYNPNMTTLRSTDKQRTIESGKAFAQGLFPDEVIEFPKPLKVDKLLWYYTECPKYVNGIKENSNTKIEQELFKSSKEAMDMVKRINMKLGFSQADQTSTQASSTTTTEAATEKPSEKPTEKSLGVMAEKPSEESTEKSADDMAEKSSEKSNEKSAEIMAEKPSEESTEKSADKLAEKPTEKSAEMVTEKSAEKEAELSTTEKTSTLVKNVKITGKINIFEATEDPLLSSTKEKMIGEETSTTPEYEADIGIEEFAEEDKNSTKKILKKREARAMISMLSFDDIEIMYELCTFNKAIEPNETSVWCAAFSKEDLEVMEYYQMLECWYENGYAYNINTQIACPLIKDLVSIFDGPAVGKNVPSNSSAPSKKATFYFGHSSGILSFLSLLGINEDSSVFTSTTYSSSKDRKYVVSEMSPFASNVGFLQMDCEETPKQRVMTFLQEKPVKLLKCDKLDCDWTQFKAIYKDKIQCDWDKICNDDGKPLKMASLANLVKQSSSEKVNFNYILLIATTIIVHLVRF